MKTNSTPWSAAYIYAVTFAAVLTVSLALASTPLSLTTHAMALIVFGVMFGSRTLAIGDALNMCVATPFIFAAFILEGPIIGMCVAVISVLVAAAQGKPHMRPRQAIFNVSCLVLSTEVGWLIFRQFNPSNSLAVEDSAAAVIFSSVGFFLTNTWLIAIVISLETEVSPLRLWTDSILWSFASYLVAASLGLAVAVLLDRFGVTVAWVLAPSSYLILYSYRLYSDRLDEKQKRIATIEKHNFELESKVKERTERLRGVNKQLQFSNRKLAEASRLKSAFLANVSHELRTPLNAIIGFSQLLKNDAFGSLGEEQEEFADEIYTSGNNLLALINDLLDLSKIEAGKMDLHTEICSPATLVTEAVSLVSVLASNKNIDLVVVSHSDDQVASDRVASDRVECDPRKVKQVLWNLISNAIKFTPENGTVRVTLDRVDEGFRFAVTDTGIGIAPEDAERIFEPFFQVDGSHSKRHGGTGLGLAISRQFAQLHGGYLSVSRGEEGGAHFEFHLPLRALLTSETTGESA